MRRLIVPMLALGVALVLASSASADGLFHRHGCGDPCKPACEPACKPCCPKPACAPRCAKPRCCDPCDPCARHRLAGCVKDWFHNLRPNRCCQPCAPGCGAPAEAHEGHAIIEPMPAPTLTPVPANSTTTVRSRSRFSGF